METINYWRIIWGPYGLKVDFMMKNAMVTTSKMELGAITQVANKCLVVTLYDENDHKIGELVIGRSYIGWKPYKGQKKYRRNIEDVIRFFKRGEKY